MSSSVLTPDPIDPAVVYRLRLEAVGKACASWFLWLAGLSMVNSVLAASGAHLHFLFGLGVTSIVDAVAQRAGATGIVLNLVINAFIAGVFLLFWYFGKQGHKWAFLVGMGLYVIDGLILLLVTDYLGAAFHLWVLYRLYQGYTTLSRFMAAQQVQMAAAGGPILPQ
jgi:MFS family permease